MPPPVSLLITKWDGRLFQGRAEHIRVPVADGTIGILAHHAPLVANLGYGTISVRVYREAQVRYFSCTGGVVHVTREGRVDVFLDSGEAAEDIDIQRATSAEMRARERIRRAREDSSIDLDRAMAALQRALVREKTYSRLANL
jgi:F-type H+-transporting ATPase subunit epsilon